MNAFRLSKSPLSVPVVAVEELLYLPIGLWMLNTRWYQLYPTRFDMPLEPAIPLLHCYRLFCVLQIGFHRP